MRKSKNGRFCGFLGWKRGFVGIIPDAKFVHSFSFIFRSFFCFVRILSKNFRFCSCLVRVLPRFDAVKEKRNEEIAFGES